MFYFWCQGLTKFKENPEKRLQEIGIPYFCTERHGLSCIPALKGGDLRPFSITDFRTQETRVRVSVQK